MDDEDSAQIDESNSSSMNATATAEELQLDIRSGQLQPENMIGRVSELMENVTQLARRASQLSANIGTVASIENIEDSATAESVPTEDADEMQQEQGQVQDQDQVINQYQGHNQDQGQEQEHQMEVLLPNYSPSRASVSSRHSGSDMSLDSPVSEDDSDAEAVPRWMIPANRVRSAVDMLVAQARNRDGGIATLMRTENFLQRVRSMVFSQDRFRNRPSDDTNADAINGVPSEVPESTPPSVDIAMEEGVLFDTNLPAEHSYFGNNLSRVPGVDYLEVGSTHRMLIFMHQHILFPGEVLPFMIDANIIDDVSEDTGRDGVIFGIGFPLMQPPDDNQHKLYGVTCQIYEKGESGQQNTFYKSRVLQRIVINCDDIQGPPQYIARNPTMKCYSKVKILPEYFLPEPLKCIDMGSLNRFRDIPSMQDKFRRYQLSTTPWPYSACLENSFEHIVEKARQKLEVHKIDTMPKCPIQLSFWLVRNLHLTEKMMRSTFLTDSVNIRLKIIDSALKQESVFYCRYCNSSVAYCSDLFAMSKHGVQTQYCNAAGYIHETNTVYRVISDAIGYSGEPSTEFSWFPGYQWHIIICKFCAQHVGWEFKAVKPNLSPKVFFGLAGSSVRIGKSNERSPAHSTFVVSNLLRLVSRELDS